VEVAWWYWAFATWVVAVAVLMPLTLGGLGVRESSFSALLKHAGATGAQGASTGFALALLLVVVNGAGLIAAELAERIGIGASTADNAPRVRRGSADTVTPDQI
jgi:hypothetical protein